jgi:hypothetical protein
VSPGWDQGWDQGGKCVGCLLEWTRSSCSVCHATRVKCPGASPGLQHACAPLLTPPAAVAGCCGCHVLLAEAGEGFWLPWFRGTLTRAAGIHPGAVMW